jgi:hypothetical protein
VYLGNISPGPTSSPYIRKEGGELSHTPLHTPLDLPFSTFVLFNFCSSRSTLEGLARWRRSLGENKKYLFSKVMSSSYQYSCCYELEYNYIDIFMIYELEYSPYVMFMSYLTPCFIVHTMFMIRFRLMLRWWFIMLSSMPKSFTCRSVGSGTRGDLGGFSICGHGARIYRNG